MKRYYRFVSIVAVHLYKAYSYHLALLKMMMQQRNAKVVLALPAQNYFNQYNHERMSLK